MIKVETAQNANLTATAMNLLDTCTITWNYLITDDLVCKKEYEETCRHMLQIIWIVERFEQAPNNFETLRDVIAYKSELNAALDELLSRDFVLVNRSEIIDEFIQENLTYLRMAVEFLE